uniref:Uncharacterized protein n=1 Tax=viral metagenome TaxID=1070528 RepID=A0A6C0EKC4_9ZZZZ
MFNRNDPIDVLIYSSPKGGGNTYQQLLIKNGYKTWYTHNKYFFKNPGPICQNTGIELEDYIKLQINYRKNNPKLKKLKILGSWREIIEQQISSFFQNYRSWHIPLKLDFVKNTNDFDINNVYKYINYFNNYYLSCDEDPNNFFELFTDIKLSSFIKKAGYFILETSDIDFYITKFRDIGNIGYILSNIMNDKNFLNSGVMSFNSSTNKPYKKIYDLFIDKYYLPKYVYNFLSTKCKFLNFLLNRNELCKYLHKWRLKIDTDKSLMIKNDYFILQNDTNKGYEKYINNDTYCLSKRFNNLPDNYFCLLYPDKHILLKEFLPNYVVNKINDNCFKNLINNERIFLNIDIINKSDFYKHDTHMNLKGTLKLFKRFINMINETVIDKITVSLQESELKVEQKNPVGWYCYGDLLWNINIDQNKIQNMKFENEVVYSAPMENIYTNKYGKIINYYTLFSIIDKLSLREIIIDKDDEVNWTIISENILRNINKNSDNNKKVLIYYDSYTCSLIPILFKTFKECVMIKEVFTYNHTIIKTFQPDLIFDLSILRFNID